MEVAADMPAAETAAVLECKPGKPEPRWKPMLLNTKTGNKSIPGSSK
jgi:hypothetical protein